MRALVALVLVGCGGGQTPIETVIVSPLRVPCQGFEPTMCLEMMPEASPTERVFFGIDGYSHRWGFEAEMTIRREQVEPVPDGSSENLIMLELIGEVQRTTEPFDISFPSGGGWFFGPSGSVMLTDGTTVECEATLCSMIDSVDNTFSPYAVTFELVGDQALRALAVTQ